MNPAVDHPRWSQATERRLPSLFKNTKTMPFNGYGDQVASMYAGHGSEEAVRVSLGATFLSAAVTSSQTLRWVVKPVVFLAALVPFALLVSAAL